MEEPTAEEKERLIFLFKELRSLLSQDMRKLATPASKNHLKEIHSELTEFKRKYGNVQSN